MANGHGGDRRPNNPSPVPMPGQLSRRTDGGPADRQPVRNIPGGGYGDSQDMRQIQGGSPMEGSAQPQANPSGRGASLDGLLDEPSQRPDEPLTAGAPFGEGVGPQAAGIEASSLAGQDAKFMRKMLPTLEWIANSPSSNPSTRQMVRVLKGSL